MIASFSELHFYSLYTRNTIFDLVIYKGERFRTTNILDVRCFTKATETWCYLDRSSCHNPQCLGVLFKGRVNPATIYKSEFCIFSPF